MNSDEIKFPLFLINFKCYEEALGDKSIELARIAKEVSEKINLEIVVAPVLTDIREVARIGIKVFAQAADPVDTGSYTGHIPLEAIKLAGAKGVIINHSEKRLPFSGIEYLVNKCKVLNLFSLVCAANVEECVNFSILKPNAIAIEPPELIGTGRSVSKYKPDSIVKAAEILKNSGIRLLCGAGISNGEDVYAALSLGSEGILVSSSIVKAKRPREKIEEMALAFKKFYGEL